MDKRNKMNKRKSNLIICFISAALILPLCLPVSAQDQLQSALEETVNSERETGAKYLTFEGTITNVVQTEQTLMIAVESIDEETVVYHIHDGTLLLNTATMEPINAEDLKEGLHVAAAYPVNTPAAMSEPPQISPEVVVIKDEESKRFVKVDFFDKQGLSSDGKLKLNIVGSTIIVDSEGGNIAKEETADRNLAAFYTITTRSIPPQAVAEKMIVLKNQEIPSEPEETEPAEAPEPEQPQTPAVNAETLVNALDAEQIHEKDGVKYVKLSDVAEQLGYGIEWFDAEKTVALAKGPASFRLKIGDTRYSEGQAEGIFTHAPFIRNDRTFVEESFVARLCQFE